VLLYDGNLDAADISALETYLIDKYGLTFAWTVMWSGIFVVWRVPHSTQPGSERGWFTGWQFFINNQTILLHRSQRWRMSDILADVLIQSHSHPQRDRVNEGLPLLPPPSSIGVESLYGENLNPAPLFCWMLASAWFTDAWGASMLRASSKCMTILLVL
jgi:hypothetical protein